MEWIAAYVVVVVAVSVGGAYVETVVVPRKQQEKIERRVAAYMRERR